MDDWQLHQERCNDPVTLGKMLNQWRRGRNIMLRDAADLLGVSWRTLEGIEQGRGFRYPQMLVNSMMYLDQVYRQANEATDGQES